MDETNFRQLFEDNQCLHADTFEVKVVESLEYRRQGPCVEKVDKPLSRGVADAALEEDTVIREPLVTLLLNASVELRIAEKLRYVSEPFMSRIERITKVLNRWN